MAYRNTKDGELIERRFTSGLLALGEKRVLTGVAMPYGTRAQLPGGIVEEFAPGAFANLAMEGIALSANHDGAALAVTPGTLRLLDTADALTINATLPETRAADDALANVRAGVHRGLSVEFHCVRDDIVGGVRIVHEARLVGVSLTHRPAYGGTSVAARSAALDAQPSRPKRRIWL